ncbi:RidA family protein [uncultured Clostridium sp.]|uniref:RidA family protein n=1 Tax=uncultured Clostridium sp. TaxID=59620 RepID=UPI00258A1B75|nr:RidA family protein [uncultured Clostridium sp.]
MKPVVNENAPRGHYTPGMICGNTLYISGQTSADPVTKMPVAGGFEAEMQMALHKMESVLKAAGCTKESVVMCKIYLTSMELWDRANQVYGEFFGDHKPARIVLPVGSLSNGCQVEIEAVAEV